MSALPLSSQAHAGRTPARDMVDATSEPPWVRRTLIAVALVFLTLFLFVPLVSVFFGTPHYGATLLRVYEQRSERRRASTSPTTSSSRPAALPPN